MIDCIYRQEESGSVMACTIFEITGGPKRFMRIWDRMITGPVEWGWVLHESAVKIWEAAQ